MRSAGFKCAKDFEKKREKKKTNSNSNRIENTTCVHSNGSASSSVCCWLVFVRFFVSSFLLFRRFRLLVYSRIYFPIGYDDRKTRLVRARLHRHCH